MIGRYLSYGWALKTQPIFVVRTKQYAIRTNVLTKCMQSDTLNLEVINNGNKVG